MLNDGKIVALKKQIEELRKQKTKNLSPEQYQLITDRIQEIKREIEELSKPQQQIVPVVNARTVSERSNAVPVSSSRRGISISI